MKGVTLNERVNIAMVNYLYTEFTFDVYKEHHSKRNDLTGDKTDDIKAEYKRFKTLLRKYIDSPDNLSVEYSHSTGKDFGRVFSKGIQGLSKKYRGALMGDLVTDIDMVNCHPNILHMICERNDIDCPCLRTYILERDQILMNFSKTCNITKEQAKTYFLKATNDCKTSKIAMPFFNAYDAELKNIQKKIMKLSEFEFIMPHADEKDRNKQGSFINCVMCYYESQIIMDVKEFLEKESFEVAALMHDGIMIYGDEYQNSMLLETLDAFVEEKWGYPFKFVYKQHQMCIEIPQRFEQPSISPTYQTLRDAFNKTHFKCGANYICEGVLDICAGDNEDEDEPLRIMNKKQISDTYCHLNADDKDGSFITHWLANKDNTMRFYKDMDVFPNPSLCPKSIYNLWEPFHMEKDIKSRPTFTEKCEELNILLHHIKILCNHDEGIYTFLLDWIANMLQYPENKSVVPIMICKQGAGKGLLIDLLRNLIGEEKFLESDEPDRDVWGKFNAAMGKKFLVHLNELEMRHVIGNQSTLKALVTQKTMQINAKGKDQVTIKSFHHFIVTTNKPNPIPTSDDDRRNIIWESSAEKKGDKSYFTKMYKMIEDEDVLRTVWKYFTSRQVKEMINEEDFPVSEYHEELKLLQRDPIIFWLETYTLSRIKEPVIQVATFVLWESYQDYMKSRNFKLEHTNINTFAQKLTRLGKEINEKYPDAFIKSKSNTTRKTKLDIGLLAKYFDITDEVGLDDITMIDDPE